MEKVQVNVWNGLYDGVTNAMRWTAGYWGDAAGDVEPAALGRMRTDGDYAHGAPGDGLSILDEYRGYVLDGGANGFAAGHHRLSFARKELLVEVSELPGLAERGANSLNPAAATNFNSHAVMTAVADFYGNPTRGMGIDLYWATDAFFDIGHAIQVGTAFVIPDHQRFNGCLMFHQNNVENILTNDAMHIMEDLRLLNPQIQKHGGRKIYMQYYYRENRNNFISYSRNTKLVDFVKVVLLDRIGSIQPIFDEFPCGLIQFNNAQTPVVTNAPLKEGCFLCILGIAEEKPFISDSKDHYSELEYRQIITFSFAHEIGHLITMRQKANTSLLDDYGHIDLTNALMSCSRSGLPLESITSPMAELSVIGLRDKMSVERR